MTPSSVTNSTTANFRTCLSSQKILWPHRIWPKPSLIIAVGPWLSGVSANLGTVTLDASLEPVQQNKGMGLDNQSAESA
jgi:hypothetical protein